MEGEYNTQIAEHKYCCSIRNNTALNSSMGQVKSVNILDLHLF